MELHEFEEYTYDKEIEKNLFVKIVTSPKEAFRFISKHQYEKHMIQLLVLAGMSSGLDKAVKASSNGNSNMIFTIIAIVVGGLFAWIGYYIFAGALSLSGRWLDGQGRTDTIFPVLAYASIPTILSSVFMLARLLILGQTENDTTGIIGLLNSCAIFCELGLWLWSIILYVIGLAAAQQFSIWKAILNLLLPVLFIVVPLLLIFFLTTTTS